MAALLAEKSAAVGITTEQARRQVERLFEDGVRTSNFNVISYVFLYQIYIQFLIYFIFPTNSLFLFSMETYVKVRLLLLLLLL